MINEEHKQKAIKRLEDLERTVCMALDILQHPHVIQTEEGKTNLAKNEFIIGRYRITILDAEMYD